MHRRGMYARQSDDAVVEVIVYEVGSEGSYTDNAFALHDHAYDSPSPSPSSSPQSSAEYDVEIISSTEITYYPYTTTTTQQYSPSPVASSSSTTPSVSAGVGYYYGTGTSTNGTASADNANASAASANGQQSGSAHIGQVLAGVFGAIFAIALAATVVFCCKRRRAQRRLKREEEEYMRQRPMQSLPGSAMTSRISLNRSDLFDVVPLPPPLARYSRVVPPSRGDSAMRTQEDDYLPNRRLMRSSTVSSSWADDSEIDALATDGSTIARTISTHSNSSRLSQDTITGGTATDNPFDHPAYTLMTANSRRARVTPTTTGTYTSSGPSPLNTLTTATSIDPFADSNSPSSDRDDIESPISSISPVQTNPASRSLADMFGSPSDADMARGATIIQHVDAGRALPLRAAQPGPDRLGEGEVHIPPTYMELYPGRNVA